MTRRVMDTRILQEVGKHSYALYLWHWPLLVLADGTSTGDLAMVWRLGLLLASGVLARLTYRYVEAPVRFHPWLVTRHLRTATAALAVTAVSVGAAVVVTAPPTFQTGMHAQQDVDAGLDSLLAGEGTDQPVPDNLVPALVEARGDLPRLYADGCHADFDATAPPGHCAYAEVGSTKTVMLFGDSHAAHWFPALEEFASRQGWELISRTKSSCTPYDLAWHREGRPYVTCTRWREGVVDEILERQPDLLVVSGRYGHGPAAFDSRQWAAGMHRTLGKLDGIPTVVLGNMPIPSGDVPVCLSANPESARACAVTLDEARDPDHLDAEREAVRDAGAVYVDLPAMLCTERHCPVVAGRYLVYRDNHHLTRRFSASLSDELEPFLREAMGEEPDGGEVSPERRGRTSGPQAQNQP